MFLCFFSSPFTQVLVMIFRFDPTMDVVIVLGRYTTKRPVLTRTLALLNELLSCCQMEYTLFHYNTHPIHTRNMKSPRNSKNNHFETILRPKCHLTRAANRHICSAYITWTEFSWMKVVHIFYIRNSRVIGDGNCSNSIPFIHYFLLTPICS